jgi:hypothetical protein
MLNSRPLLQRQQKQTKETTLIILSLWRNVCGAHSSIKKVRTLQGTTTKGCSEFTIFGLLVSREGGRTTKTILAPPPPQESRSTAPPPSPRVDASKYSHTHLLFVGLVCSQLT